MVVRADVEEPVRLAAVPTCDLAGSTDVDVPLSPALRPLVWMQQPAPRDHGMSLQQLERTRGAHLRRDDARDVFLDGDVVNGRETAVVFDDAQRAAEDL